MIGNIDVQDMKVLDLQASKLSNTLATNLAPKEKFISKDATETEIEGYFKSRPSKAAPTVPDNIASEPKRDLIDSGNHDIWFEGTQ